MTRRAVLVMSIATMIAAAVRAQNPSPRPSDANRAQAFLTQLQHAVDTGDRPGVARLFRYPSTVLASGFNIPVANTQELLRMYELVFNSEMRCAIVESGIARAGAPRPKHPVSVQPDGVSLANGLVWAQKSGTQYRISRVSVPAAASYSHVTEPRRVRFPPNQRGEKSIEYYNWLQRDDVDSYLLAGRKGQLLQVRIEGFEGGDATVRVTEAGSPPGTSMREAVRTWSDYLPATSDYRIEVIRLAPFCDPSFKYKVFITLR
jgi:hypothetical protein